ncbi:hypothetical protein [Fuchsiella alkaliacetigena]|uniref:hypothetical protein n=1 Tax=Fuchsiella alkaliacetigena TaxID=957042 RepID=UPI00200A68AC|nr:hypothetical protein [Fuchsiella alkaliacetigena]MCK8823977.1 hypothetical protein [Fuchsiella alkaliacetigena]
MFKTKKFLYICILLILLFTITACFNGSEEKEPKTEWNKHSRSNFAIELPSTWEIIRENNNEIAISPIDDSEVAIALFLPRDEPYGSLEGIKNNFLTIIKENYLEITIETQEKIILNEEAAYEVDFQGIDLNAGEMKGHLIVAQQEGKPFVIIFMAAEDKYEKRLKEARRIVTSFSLK